MDCKRVAQNTLLDRISELPNNVIDIILNHVSLLDAVRTSILSRNWRLHWTRLEILVLDDDFFYDVLPDRGHEIEIVAAVYKDTLSPDVINLWILAVSQHEVQELTLDYDYECDQIAPFPSAVAYQRIEKDLKAPLEDIFSEICPLLLPPLVRFTKLD